MKTQIKKILKKYSPILVAVFLILNLFVTIRRGGNYLFNFDTTTIPLFFGLLTSLVALYWAGNVKTIPSGKNKKNTRNAHLINKSLQKKILLIILTLASILIYFTNLGKYKLSNDEYNVFDTAAGLVKSSSFYKWDWIENTSSQETFCTQDKEDVYCHYFKGFPHTIVVTGSFKLFGISELSARIPSAIFGVAFILLMWKLTMELTGNSDTAFLTSFAVLLNPKLIEIFRTARMYSLLLPVFLLAFYFGYRGINGKVSDPPKPLNQINFDYRSLIIGGLLSILSGLIHPVGLIIGLCIFLYVVLLAIIEKEKRQIYLSAILLGFLAAFLGFNLIFPDILKGVLEKSFAEWFTIGNNNYMYTYHLFSAPYVLPINLALLSVGALLAIATQNKFLRYAYIYVIVTYIFFRFFGNRYDFYNYTSHIVPIVTLVISHTTIITLRQFNSKLLKIAVIICILVGLSINFASQVNKMYIEDELYGDPSIACNTISKFNASPKVTSKPTVYAKFLRKYYCQNLPESTTIIELPSYKSHKEDYNHQAWLNHFYMQNTEQIWFVWETEKTYHIHPEMLDFIQQNSSKYHGSSVDESKMEVYKFIK